MKDEIKGILNQLEKVKDGVGTFIGIDNKGANLLLDCITNLQQENERLKVKYNEEKSHQINYNYFETLYSKSTKEIVIDDLVWKCEELDNFKKEYEKLYIEKEDYKSRIEKAVEYIKDRFDEDKGIWIIDCYELLNILNGRSDE